MSGYLMVPAKDYVELRAQNERMFRCLVTCTQYILDNHDARVVELRELLVRWLDATKYDAPPALLAEDTERALAETDPHAE